MNVIYYGECKFNGQTRELNMSRTSWQPSLKAHKRKTVKEKVHYNSEQEESLPGCPQACSYTPLSTVRSPCSFNMDERGALVDDQESEPDRSNPMWKLSPSVSSEDEISEAPEEDLEKSLTLWEEIMQEYENERIVLRNLNMERKPFEPELPKGRKLTGVQYLQEYIFPVLCPALEDMLFEAKKEDCLQIQKCVFNGLDRIAELLWNRNPMHPKRRYKNIFDIPFVKIWLYHHPRPIYPLSWIWTREQAITVMQSYIRRYFVCCDPDCYEMRKFWQIFKQEKRDEERAKELEHFEEVRGIADDLLNEIIAICVHRAEEKIRGCFCLSKPCHCKCMCFKWCKCCRCYKPKKSVAKNFYSNINTDDNKLSSISRNIAEFKK